MRALTTLSLVALAAALGLAADQGERAVDYSEAGAVIEALYAAVSFERGGEPDWSALRTLFLKGAVLAQPRRGTQELELLTLEEFIGRYRADMKTFEARGTGFYERIVGSNCSSYGRTAHCQVVFEARFERESADPVGRGVDDIQLVQNEGRWWIAAIATEYELPDRPIPPGLLAGMESPSPVDGGPLAGCTKLGFDAAILDDRGLTGPGDGTVALAYEFCIPKDPGLVDRVRSVDPTVAIHAGSTGRIGCSEDEVLCVGSTHQPNHLEVLAGLCELDFISRIERALFE